MPPLRRHQLICLTEAGWADLARRAPCELPPMAVARWRRSGWPLVLCRQDPGTPEGWLQAGWPLPTRWGRGRCTVQVPATDVAYLAEFPGLLKVLSVVHARRRDRLVRLASRLASAGLRAQVYGSHGWQWLTGQVYLHERSDLDLWIGVADGDEADLAARYLAEAGEASPRLDGELVFPDGGAVSWREWARCRSGHSHSLLIKDLHGVRLSRPSPSSLPEDCAA